MRYSRKNYLLHKITVFTADIQKQLKTKKKRNLCCADITIKGAKKIGASREWMIGADYLKTIYA